MVCAFQIDAWLILARRVNAGRLQGVCSGERIGERGHRGEKGVEGPKPQATIKIGRNQFANPLLVPVGAPSAVGPGPESDDGYQTRFLVGNHRETSGETCQAAQRIIDVRRYRGIEIANGLGCRNELET